MILKLLPYIPGDKLKEITQWITNIEQIAFSWTFLN